MNGQQLTKELSLASIDGGIAMLKSIRGALSRGRELKEVLESHENEARNTLAEFKEADLSTFRETPVGDWGDDMDDYDSEGNRRE